MAGLAGCAGTAPTVPRPTRPNVVVIIADSLRADRLRPYDSGGVAVPALEALARRGTLFRNAWAVAPWTAPSVVSIFTGLYPPSHGVVFRDDTTSETLPTLPRLLARRGYRLGNFAFFSGVSYFRNLGFPEPEPGVGHENMGASFRRWVAGRAPFCAWVHLIETHLPYGATGYSAPQVKVHGSSGLEAAQLHAEVPVGSVEFVPGDAEKLRALYDQDVASMDAAVGEVMAALEAAGQTQRTIVVFVADHGEELLDHGWIGHASTALKAKLVPEILHVPLIMAGPGVLRGTVTDALVQQVDIFPTLCRLTGVQAPRPLDGVPLVPPGRSPRRFAFFDSSAGGNLTPDALRGERLQGISDGVWLLVVHSGGKAPETTFGPVADSAVPPPAGLKARYDRELTRWQRRQSSQRLKLLAGSMPAGLPPEAELAAFAPRIAVRAPAAGASLGHASSGGQLVLEWQGPGARFAVQYEVGSGLTRVHGAFSVQTNRVVFGPFPEGFWNDLANHNPFRFRVVSLEARTRSEWVEFRLVPSGVH